VEESVEYSQLAVFKGTYRHKIDPKGRLPVPAAFRRVLAEQGAASVVVTLLDQCLAAWPPAEWDRLETQLASLPAFSKPVKALTRLLVSRAADCEIDVQGRILLPPLLRQAAGVAGDVVVVGVLNRFEVWPPPAWSSFLQESERLLDDVSLDVQWPMPPAASSSPPSPGDSRAPSSTGKP
jgi:transcriptional regulator MraZ